MSAAATIIPQHLRKQPPKSLRSLHLSANNPAAPPGKRDRTEPDRVTQQPPRPPPRPHLGANGHAAPPPRNREGTDRQTQQLS
ncbi:hypothetical protein Aple_087490 [Acrocarpospora pleiomorpha]|uniref:Uncharacterized protein n=1 Tax=Acrocarpospora pleiomorpha TaxID=90975 RepID=A0A5M3XXZ6_9ACTN|nr:hypothetical protein Aple_087490 [Acrocarpospora pleiomorpha]